MKVLWAAALAGFSCLPATLAQADMTVIEATIPVAPPGWAVLERRLLAEMSEAAVRYAAHYTRSGGTLIWKTEGSASLDDLPESFYNFPLLYALGGDERLRELAFRQWEATTRQLTYMFPVFYREFPKSGDWFHIGEGFLYFYLLALADPTDYEHAARARRFAAFYMGEDPEAPNYDRERKLIRSPHTGSLGPRFGDPEKAAPYGYSKGMSSYGLPLQDLPGISRYEDLKDPEKARRMGREMAARIYRGDVPANLAATSLAVHAWLLTGEDKYAAWVREYTGAWLERTRANGGLTPDNVGLSGKIGEYHNGKWWGGLYGWQWPHGFYNIGMATQIAAANAMLVSGGEPGWLELVRSNLDRLLEQGKTVQGAFVVPYKHGDRGWFAYQPVEKDRLISLWYMSMAPEDWERIEKVRRASSRDWHEATGAPFPNNGYSRLPDEREDCWNCDVEGLVDWNRVLDLRNKEDRGHEAPWIRFLAGENPDYPERILRVAYGQMTRKLQQIRGGVLLLDYDPRKPDASERVERKLENVHEHHWMTVNPVTTEALIQLTMGAPQLVYNGGLLHARVRYFDPARRRPGLPPDVAALVEKVEAERTVLLLINLSPFETREVIVQGGAFGEHQFTTARFERRIDREPEQPDFFLRPEPKTAPETVTVNRKFFLVRLPPGNGIRLDLGTRRFANRPSYAFPWHGDRVPIR
jgi:hypothetical protein